jgi:hypothetical protein
MNNLSLVHTVLALKRTRSIDTPKHRGHYPSQVCVMPGLVARIAMSAALLGVVTLALPSAGRAQEIDLSKIDKFESLSTGTLRVGSPPKTIVDDGERHVIVLTIWDADAETKVYWRSSSGPRTTVIPGRGVQTFQTLGELKLEAVGEPAHEVQYGYMLLGLEK